MDTWLVIAAERRELDGIIKRSGEGKKLDWPVEFARQVEWRGDRWMWIANGPGTGLVEEALKNRTQVSGIISTGFCGALDPALRIGDIVIDSAATEPRQWRNWLQATAGQILCSDRVAVTSAEKLALHAETGAAAVEMEAAAVARIAKKWSVPFYSIRAVSDVALEDMPLDFNLYRDGSGRFSRSRIARAAMARPFTTIPALLRLNRHCQIAAESLGDFFANCQL
jgi:adenosylhomocysteine nucleosidase